MIPDTSVPESYERARAAYLRALRAEERGMSAGRFLARVLHALWSRFPGHLSLIVVVLVTTLSLLCVVGARAVDVPDRIVAALCQVESGTTWHGVGEVRGTWSRGGIGEVGPWQLSPAVLHDLRAYDRRHRVHADPVLAESLTRAWLAHLYRSTGNWPDTVAAFHAGLAGRHRRYAREYAERVLALASVL